MLREYRIAQSLRRDTSGRKSTSKRIGIDEEKIKPFLKAHRWKSQIVFDQVANLAAEKGLGPDVKDIVGKPMGAIMDNTHAVVVSFHQMQGFFNKLLPLSGELTDLFGQAHLMALANTAVDFADFHAKVQNAFRIEASAVVAVEELVEESEKSIVKELQGLRGDYYKELFALVEAAKVKDEEVKEVTRRFHGEPHGERRLSEEQEGGWRAPVACVGTGLLMVMALYLVMRPVCDLAEM